MLEWSHELDVLERVAKSDPHNAYALLCKGVIPKWKYLMRTTQCDPSWFQPLEDKLMGSLLTSLFGRAAQSWSRDRMALPCRHGGLGIPNPCQLAVLEYQASCEITKDLRAGILSAPQPTRDHNPIEVRRQLKKERENKYKIAADTLQLTLMGRA